MSAFFRFHLPQLRRLGARLLVLAFVAGGMPLPAAASIGNHCAHQANGGGASEPVVDGVMAGVLDGKSAGHHTAMGHATEPGDADAMAHPCCGGADCHAACGAVPIVLSAVLSLPVLAGNAQPGAGAPPLVRSHVGDPPRRPPRSNA